MLNTALAVFTPQVRKLKTVLLETNALPVYSVLGGADDGGCGEHLAIGSNLCICDTPKKMKTVYAGPMDYLSQHLTSLRQEITDLRNMNVLYAQQSAHSATEQTASDVRANRLLQIKQELSKMRDCPPEHSVWWDKVRKPKRAA